MDVVDSVCAPPATAQAYVFNATVVPVGPLGYLALWPDTETQPPASTLNAVDGAITSNMAIVPNVQRLNRRVCLRSHAADSGHIAKPASRRNA